MYIQRWRKKLGQAWMKSEPLYTAATCAGTILHLIAWSRTSLIHFWRVYVYAHTCSPTWPPLYSLIGMFFIFISSFVLSNSLISFLLGTIHVKRQSTTSGGGNKWQGEFYFFYSFLFIVFRYIHATRRPTTEVGTMNDVKVGMTNHRGWAALFFFFSFFPISFYWPTYLSISRYHTYDKDRQRRGLRMPGTNEGMGSGNGVQTMTDVVWAPGKFFSYFFSS